MWDIVVEIAQNQDPQLCAATTEALCTVAKPLMTDWLKDVEALPSELLPVLKNLQAFILELSQDPPEPISREFQAAFEAWIRRRICEDGFSQIFQEEGDRAAREVAKQADVTEPLRTAAKEELGNSVASLAPVVIAEENGSVKGRVRLALPRVLDEELAAPTSPVRASLREPLANAVARSLMLSGGQ